MTVYARSDISCVALSKAHGGCGEVHSRPVVEGAPVKLWKLDCPQCGDHLRSDPLWSSTVSEIPETYDEKVKREDQERRGQREQADATAHALERLAQLGDLPSVLGKMVELMTGNTPVAAIQGENNIAHLCRNGHANRAGTKFCGECGADMADAANVQPKAAIEGVPEVTKEQREADYESMTVAQLRELVASRGKIQGSARTKAELIELLQNADSDKS